MCFEIGEVLRVPAEAVNLWATRFAQTGATSSAVCAGDARRLPRSWRLHEVQGLSAIVSYCNFRAGDRVGWLMRDERCWVRTRAPGR